MNSMRLWRTVSPFSGLYTHSGTPAVNRRLMTCRNCNKVFLNRCSLQRHRKKCEGDFHLACHLCDQRFYRRDLYRDHLASKHNTWIPGKRKWKWHKLHVGGGVRVTNLKIGGRRILPAILNFSFLPDYSSGCLLVFKKKMFCLCPFFFLPFFLCVCVCVWRGASPLLSFM